MHCRSISGLSVTIVSNLPFGAGLGSSAAYSVCLSAAFLTAMADRKSAGTCESSNISAQHEQQSPSTSSQCTKYQSTSLDSELSDSQCFPQDIRRRLEIESCMSLGDLSAKPWKQVGLLDSVNKWGFEAEKLIHGTPSGIDNSISTFGMLSLQLINWHTCQGFIQQKIGVGVGGKLD